jgi:dTDP-4-amino-4,6-dideoxygalactose transaminase
MERLQALSKTYKFKILEDACHALGGGYWDKNNDYNKIGNCKHSDVAVFSFHPIKNITTGEGGAITTNDKKLYQKMLLLRNHGITRDENKFINKDMAYTENEGLTELNKWYYEMHHLAHNFRLTDFQCALGNSQLKKLNLFVKKRQELANLYISLISKEIKKGVKTPKFSSKIFHAYHLFIVLIDFDTIRGGRSKLMNFLSDNQIQTQVHYIPIHLQPFYKKLYPAKFNLPNSEIFYNKSLSLPLFYDMTEDQVVFVINKLKEGLEILKA